MTTTNAFLWFPARLLQALMPPVFGIIPLIIMAAMAAKSIMDKKKANNAANAANAAGFQESETKYARDFQGNRDATRQGYLGTEYAAPKQNFRLQDAIRLGRLYGVTGSRERAPKSLVDLLQTGRKLAPWEEPTRVAGVAPVKQKLGALDYGSSVAGAVGSYYANKEKQKATDEE